LNICYIASDVVVPHHRGASTHTLELARHLADRGHVVNLVSRRGLGQRQIEEISGVTVHRVSDGIIFNNPYSSYRRSYQHRRMEPRVLKTMYGIYFTRFFPLFVAMKASRIIRDSRSEIILERETSFGAGGIASYVTGIPLALEIIGPRYNKYSVNRASLIFYYNPAMIKFSLSEKKLSRVSAAANINLFKYDSEMREKARLSLGFDEKTIVGFLGTFAEWQGVDDIVSAAGKLRNNRSFHFLMIGPYFERIAEKVRRLGLSDIFTFLGAVNYEDVPKYLCSADILLAPYNINRDPERARSGIGSSLKVFEYMACSRPVISTDVYPINEEISNGTDSVLLPPGDVQALATAIQELAADPDEQSRLGRAGRRLVERKYSWGRFAESIETKMLELVR